MYTSLTCDRYIHLCSTLSSIGAVTCEAFGGLPLCIQTLVLPRWLSGNPHIKSVGNLSKQLPILVCSCRWQSVCFPRLWSVSPQFSRTTMLCLESSCLWCYWENFPRHRSGMIMELDFLFLASQGLQSCIIFHHCIKVVASYISPSFIVYWG